MPPRLTLIANASTPAVRAAAFPLDEGLDQQGRMDAAAAAADIGKAAIVLSSPAKRAVETAIALGLNATITPALRDLDLGRWAGCNLSGIAASEPEALEIWLSTTASAPHGGESIDSLFARISVWLQEVAAQNGRVIAVTHPAVMRAAILSAIQAGPSSFWHIDIAPLSLVELSSNGRRWALKTLRHCPGR